MWSCAAMCLRKFAGACCCGLAALPVLVGTRSMTLNLRKPALSQLKSTQQECTAWRMPGRCLLVRVLTWTPLLLRWKESSSAHLSGPESPQPVAAHRAVIDLPAMMRAMPKKILLKSWNLSDLVIAPACAMGQKLEQAAKNRTNPSSNI